MLNRPVSAVVPFCALVLTVAPAVADGPFYGDPPNATHPWAVHDMNRPQPPLVTPGTFSTAEQPGRPPSDAIVLFDGTAATLDKWEADKNPAEPTKWIVKDGALQCVPGSGYIRSKDQFGDCQLHVEWAAPTKAEGHSQGRGNSGIFLMGQTEIQVLDNYDNPTYPDGFAASVYGVNPPYANALRAPGEWQIYDIIFRRPIYQDGKMLDGGRFTVMLNGVVVQDATPLEGGGGHKGRSNDHPLLDKGPLKLQDHGNPVRYRNIWYRLLPARGIDGGDMGALSPEAATAKKLVLAKSIRGDAAKLQGQAKLLRMMESLCYELDAATGKEVASGIAAWVTAVKQTPATGMEAKKGEIMQMRDAVKYLVQFKFLPEGLTALPEIEEIIKGNGWEKR
ncbi:MAG: DUF1080 domain-containing protein [Verrucomicrobia bacterium]|nr:DUF1080 domain-containing protein [Verrucomicrobiota bacterium]